MKNYKSIIKHYESCLEKHGDNHLGVDWPKIEDVNKRYDVMIDIVRLNKDKGKNISLLDFGCGTAHLYDYINKKKYLNIEYFGLDISQKFINVCREKYPDEVFFCGDILDDNFKISNYDYVLMNGVFTEKRDLSFEQMWQYFTEMLTEIFKNCKKGLAFNVMSKNVDWERDDLFHLSIDLLSEFLYKNLNRNFIIRNDYGLYEYTVYILK